MNKYVTLFGRINWTTYGLKKIHIMDAVEIIRNGTFCVDDRTRSGIYCTLACITEYIQKLPPEVDIQPIKAGLLPAVSFNGVYNNGIVEYSSITALDFDHIPSQNEYTDLYRCLMATPCVGWIFRTPSGRGLKALVVHDNTNPDMHSNMYQQLMNMFRTSYIKADPKCKDLSRRSYLCYDPDVWNNPSVVPYHFIYDKSYDVPMAGTKAYKTKSIPFVNFKQLEINDYPSDASIMNLLKSRCRRFKPYCLHEGWRRDGVYWFGTQAAKAGVDYGYGLTFVVNLYKSDEITLSKGGKFTDDEIFENYTNGYKTETFDETFRRSFAVRRNICQ